MKTEDRIENAVREGNYKDAFTYLQILLNERTIENNEKLIEVIRLVQGLEERLVKVYGFLKDYENRIFDLEIKEHHED